VYAPFGSGVLVVRKGLLKFKTAEMELIQSSGEENAGGIAALGKALVILQKIGLDLIQEEEQALTRRALRGLIKIPDIRIYGIKDPESPMFEQKGGVIVFSLKNKFPNLIAKELAEQYGIGVRYGCHCPHMLVKRLVNISPLLERFQRIILILFPKIALPGITRLSLGIGNSEEEIDILIHMLSKIAGHSRNQINKSYDLMYTRTPKLSLTEIQKQLNDFIRDVEHRVYI
jgi:selenocysteine lyase/cysteine desulfurase